MSKVVILAAGRGSRMRSGADAARLQPAQRRAAEAGLKALMPVGRPFLDYLLSRLADVGCCEVCLVTGPAHEEIRHYYRSLSLERLTISFAIQSRPQGTADALLAAASFIEQDPFLLLNSDNCYPTSALRAVATHEAAGVVGFEADALVAQSNVSQRRVGQLSVLRRDRRGNLCQIIEKPSAEILEQLPRPWLVGLNCWKMTPDILADCSAITPSVRGEYELPAAVDRALQRGVCFPVSVCREGVLDLSRPADVTDVAPFLQGQEVWL